jgi:hypothetical protein
MNSEQKQKLISQLDRWRIRASRASEIMSSLPKGLTANQEAMLQELQAKDVAGKITDKQKAVMRELIFKKSMPDELPIGVINMLQEEIDRLMYGVEPAIISTKQMEKGLLCEQDSLDLISQELSKQTGKPEFLKKNEQWLSNDYTHGTYDCLHNKVLYDAKSAWDNSSFKRSDLSEANYWQMISYLALEKRAAIGCVAYCLIDTPEHLIYDEFQRQCWSRGIIDKDGIDAQKLEKLIRANMTFSDKIPSEERFKLFYVERDSYAWADFERRVKMCRAYMINEVNIKHMKKQVFIIVS